LVKADVLASHSLVEAADAAAAGAVGCTCLHLFARAVSVQVIEAAQQVLQPAMLHLPTVSNSKGQLCVVTSLCSWFVEMQDAAMACLQCMTGSGCAALESSLADVYSALCRSELHSVAVYARNESNSLLWWKLRLEL
jgi:hypothetical protein